MKPIKCECPPRGRRTRWATILAVTAITIAAARVISAASAKLDVADYFGLYYSQDVAGAPYQGPLDFLRDAAAAHVSAQQLLKSTPSRAVVVDRPNGYLRLDDSSDTDQTLTIAVYRKADGSPLVVVGGSNCADACTYAVEFFAVSGDRLAPISAAGVVPSIKPAEFIKPGHQMPASLASIEPKINYVPARVGTTLTLTPWYGYETEEQMDKTTRAAIGNVVLDWDRETGKFKMRTEKSN